MGNAKGMLGGLVAAFILMGVIGNWDGVLRWVEEHERLAGWVQAIGSLVAIWAAFEIGASQVRATLQAQEAAHREARAAAISHARVLVIQLKIVIDTQIHHLRQWPQGSNLTMSWDGLVESLPAVDAALSTHMPAECVTSLLEIRSALSELIHLLRQGHGSLIAGGTRLELVLASCETRARNAEARLESLV